MFLIVIDIPSAEATPQAGYRSWRYIGETPGWFRQIYSSVYRGDMQKAENL